MKKGRTGEFDLIRLLTNQRGVQRQDVICGVGDDAAVVDSCGRRLLFTCDAQVSDVHFLQTCIPAYTLGQRIAAVNLSDIAAMGGIPLWALCSLLVDNEIGSDFYDEVYNGLYAELDRFGVQLVGGNMARSHQGLVADLFLVGEVEKGLELYRSGAQVGDVVCVSGALGESAAGLAFLKETSDSEQRSSSPFDPLVQKHFRPIPRIEVGQLLAKSKVVSACMDVSDGLLQDAAHLATASQVCLSIDDTLVPVTRLTHQFATQYGKDVWELALTGGEDYELLFTLPESELAHLQQMVRSETGIAVSPIGIVEANEKGMGRVKTKTSCYGEMLKAGYDHLL